VVQLPLRVTSTPSSASLSSATVNVTRGAQSYIVVRVLDATGSAAPGAYIVPEEYAVDPLAFPRTVVEVVGATVIVEPVVAATALTRVADALVVNDAGRSPPPVKVTTAVPSAAIAVPVFTTRKKYVPLTCAEAEPNEVIADPADEKPSSCVTASELSVILIASLRPRTETCSSTRSLH
jgi:hypothetical protein